MPASTILALRSQLLQRKHNAIGQFRNHLRPDTLLATLSRSVDQALRALVKIHPLPVGASMAAVGGYGRGELYPYSDVDVLILLRQPPGPQDTAAIEALVAAIWDLGIEPGHSVRTISDCQTLAASDITVETSLSESRWLAGDQNLLSELHSTMRKQLDPTRYFLAKRTEMELRHARHQNTPYALEPNCKEAPGGLRDVQVLLWLAHAAGLGRTWGDIASSDLITPAEFRALKRAELAFKRLRIELHLLTERREDRVLFDLQPALAKIYGFQASNNRQASELLMQRYYWAARVVSQMNAIIMLSLEEVLFPSPPGPNITIDNDFQLVNGRLNTRWPDGFARNPTLLFRAFLLPETSQPAPKMSAQTLRAMWHARRYIDPQFRRNPINHHHFIQIFQLKDGLMPALRQLTMFNILPRYLPVFRRIVGQMQHDLFHAYTVDQHILMVIEKLYEYTQLDSIQDFPLAHRIATQLPNYWLLYIAAFFHDIAKGQGGDHSTLGSVEARRFCKQHGLEKSDTNLIVFLVEQHLTMSLTAQKRDLSDPQVIHEFARNVQNQYQLDALYVLTVADIRGTSPKVWNSWKGKLLEDLYQRTTLALTQAQPDSDAALAQRTLAAMKKIHQLGISDADRHALWQHLNADYFMRHEPNDIAWHTQQLYDKVTSSQPIVKTRVVGKNEALQIMVYTPDRNDLFVSICRYFDHHALSIQDARIYTTHHGWALDSFIALLPRHEKNYQAHAHLVEHELKDELLTTQISYQTNQQLTTLSRRDSSRRSRLFPMTPEVQLTPDVRPGHWNLTITAADRPGLLHSLARRFASHGVSLEMAKILTLGERVEDIFLLHGSALQDNAIRLQFELSILAALTSPHD
ncbi:[protein-PII] uridylyltransferase [Alcaligenaceae bacterium]|nr:[protein-PII] uridylyltransferase [Alcaligenaceae bacterium]